MTNSKAFSLLSGLPDKELTVLAKAITDHKRNSLKKLFKLLASSRKNEEPDAAVVYKSVFGKVYSKSQDYLLRNEYRLLYDWLLIQVYSYHTRNAEFSIESRLRYFLKNGLHELFEEEFHAAWKKALAEDNTYVLLQLSDLNLNYYLSAKVQKLENAEKMEELAHQRMALLKADFLRNIRKEEIRIKLSERIISVYKPLPKPYVPLFTVDLTELEQSDLYAQYLSKRAAINFARGEEKIELLKNIIREEEVIRKYEPEPEESICRFLINLAQEHYLNSQFQEAVKYFELAYRQLKMVSAPVKETMVINYALALMRNEQFGEAEKLATEHAELMLNSKLLAGRAPFLLAALHLHGRNASAAEKYVTLEARKDGTEFYYFMRLVLSAVYYLRGDLDLALREAINIEQAVNYELNREQNLQTKISKPIVSVFRRFYSLIQTAAKEKLEGELKKIGREIKASMISKDDQSPNSVLTQWINEEIKFRLSGNKKS